MIGEIQTLLALLGTAIVAVALAFLRGKSKGKKEAQHDILKDKSDREAKGRERLRDGRDSGLSPDERVRRNDGPWTGV